MLKVVWHVFTNKQKEAVVLDEVQTYLVPLVMHHFVIDFTSAVVHECMRKCSPLSTFCILRQWCGDSVVNGVMLSPGMDAWEFAVDLSHKVLQIVG